MDSISSTKPKLVYKFHKFKSFVDLIYQWSRFNSDKVLYVIRKVVVKNTLLETNHWQIKEYEQTNKYNNNTSLITT